MPRQRKRCDEDLQALHRRGFPRSESGRSYVVSAADGEFLANAALASRKDVRDAVVAARAAVAKWAGATAYNRGQILYRIAEMLEGRRAQFVDEVRAGEGLGKSAAEGAVDAAIDRWVWYAGWSDKIAQVYGNANPVAGPYFNLTSPEPTGVVGLVAPEDSSLLGLVSVVAPLDRHRQHVRRLASETRPLPAIIADRGAGDLRSAGRGRQRAHRPGRRDRSVAGDATWTSTDSTSPESPIPASRPSWRSRPPRTSSEWSGRRPTKPGPPSQVWIECSPSWRPKTVWHPKGV